MIDPLFEVEPDLETEIAGPEVELVFRKSVDGRLPSPDDYADADAVLNGRSVHRLPAEVIALLTRCKVIQQGGVGYNHIDIAEAARRRIPVLNTPDYGTTEVADHAVALALNLLRGIQAYDRRLRRSNSSWDARWLTIVRRLSGVRAGIIGMGRIGTAVALRLRAFGMQIAFYDPYVPVGQELSLGFERFDDLDRFMARSDLLSVHAFLSAETRHIVSSRTISLLPPGAVLVNTSRGPLVDLNAVGAALQSGQLGAAGLDVFEHEPLDRTHPLIAAWTRGEEWLDERLILTPHSAFYSRSSLSDIRRLSMTYLMDYLRHHRMRTCVNAHLMDD